MNYDSTISRQPFRQRLLRTYIYLSIQFFASLSIVLMAMVWISWQTQAHLNQVGPLVEKANQLSKGVNESMLLLDKWLLAATPGTQQKNQTLWDSTIFPVAKTLGAPKGETINGNTTLLRKLQKLQIEQWIVSDLAHMQGNQYAKDLHRRKISQIEQKVFNVITKIINILSASDSTHSAPPLLTYSANIRGYFAISNSSLIQFIMTGSVANEYSFQNNLATTLDNFALLQKSHNFSGMEESLISNLENLLQLYYQTANNVIAIRYSPQWNQANFSYTNALLPLRNEVSNELKIIMEEHTATLNESSKSLIRYGYYVIFISSIIGAVAAFFLVLRARKDMNHANELEEEILLHTKQLENLSRIDQLTDLYNRRAMEELLHREISNAKRTKRTLSFAYFDVDDFKSINDNYGHFAGDEVLKQVGVALKSSIREADIPCRYGGDEFCVIFPGCSSHDANLVCQKLIKRFSAQYPDISLSIGITELDQAEEIDAETLIKITDQKMYLAKTQKGFHIRT